MSLDRKKGILVQILKSWFQVILLLFILWIGGFIWYLNKIPNPLEKTSQTVDAIVVLTGGSQRLEAGLNLLSQGQSQKLFISGVHKDVSSKEIFYLNKTRSSPLNQSIELGYMANNTQENAKETTAWLNKKGYKSIQLVTAHYHMPRSLIEFRALMPYILIQPYSVYPGLFGKSDFKSRLEQTIILIREYHKFIGAFLRIKMSLWFQRFLQ
jgi:uncharacterized SAM-binding protein YcdF (DUF218 family)